MDFGYMAQKFGSARSCLLLPHPRGIEASVTAAMWECSIALQGIKDQRPEELEPYLSRLIALLDTSGLVDPDKRGLHAVKAALFTEDELHQLSNSIDELAGLCGIYRDEVPVIRRT